MRGFALLIACGTLCLLPTAAAAAPSDDIWLAVIGDFGNRSDAERQVADLIGRIGPAAVLTTGDNVYADADYPDGVGAYYCGFIADAPPSPECPTTAMASSNSFFPATGNHDYTDGGIAAYDRFFGALKGHRTYAVTRDGIEFLFVDSQAALDSPVSMNRQRAWVRRHVRASTAQWQVVVLHHPPYSSGSVHGSTPSFQWAFAQWGVDLVLSGHDHDYERLRVNGLTYVVDGSGGADLYGFGTPLATSVSRDDASHGVLLLQARGPALIGEFMSTAGARLDSFAISPRRP